MSTHPLVPRLAAVWLIALLAPAAPAAEPPVLEEAWRVLLAGNARYIAGESTHPHQDSTRRTEVAAGQKPHAIVLCCSDSRVAPEVVFDQGLGDIFVVRVAGHVVDNMVLGSIEYAVEHLGVPLIVVLGHERCGAVAAAVTGGHVPGHIHRLAATLQPAVRDSANGEGDRLDRAVCSNVRLTVARLREAGPILHERVATGKLQIVGARYDLDSGAVELLP